MLFNIETQERAALLKLSWPCHVLHKYYLACDHAGKNIQDPAEVSVNDVYFAGWLSLLQSVLCYPTM